MFDIFIIGISGFFGSILRYLVSIWLSSDELTTFPLATLLVNVLGCLLIGILAGRLDRSDPQQRLIYLACAVGFLGAFTTFSAFGLETLTLLRNQQVSLALANIGANLVLGLTAVAAGLRL